MPNDIDNCVLTVSADDNAQFYSTVFGDDGAGYDDSDDYEDDTAEAYKPKLGDIVILGTVAM